MYPLIILHKTRICTFVFLKRTRHFIFCVPGSPQVEPGGAENIPNTKTQRVLKSCRRDESERSMYRQRCSWDTGEHAVLFSQVAKITHHYCILTRIQPQATALQEGFGEGYSNPFSYGRTRPSTPRVYLEDSSRSRVPGLGRTREISVEGREYQRSRGLIDLSDLFCQLEQRGKLRFCGDLVSQVALSVISVENKTRHCRNINDIVFASPPASCCCVANFSFDGNFYLTI